ncbi:MAG: M28 family peptidase [Candidatus Hydrogenedentota bacterium]|nr:MAG: M28 family peptidase [Candidatus Hydrogenedentota bacterium]
MEHVKVFCAEIGPRGPTTEAEARAAAYVAAKLKEFGARETSVETFRSVPSLWWAFEIAVVLALASTGLYYWTEGGSWGWSVLLCLVTLYIGVAELSFWKFSLSNFLPKRVSQNVYGKVSPKRKSHKKLVVIGHVDTNRTPVLFHPRLVRYLPRVMALAAACVILKALAFSFGTAAGAYSAMLNISIILDLPLLATLLAMLHGDLFSPFTEGANDNATGAAVVLSLAELFVRDPLEQTEYWALCTGCEEATLTGIKAFLEKHGEELRDAYFVDLECLGIGELRYITYEGMLKKYYSNLGLVRAAADAANTVGDLGIMAMTLRSGYTETAIILRKKLRGITIMAFPKGCDEIPHWHRVSDRIENVNPHTLNTAVRYLIALARELDSE